MDPEARPDQHASSPGRTLYHATSQRRAETIVSDLVIPVKFDEHASLPGREMYNVYLATSPNILSATTVVEVEILPGRAAAPW